MGAVHLFDDLIVEALRRHKPSVQCAVIQKSLHHICQKGLENIARSEMHPEGGFLCFGDHLLQVKSRQLIAGRFPGLPVLQPLFV